MGEGLLAVGKTLTAKPHRVTLLWGQLKLVYVTCYFMGGSCFGGFGVFFIVSNSVVR